MSYPALEAFEADTRVTLKIMRVFRFMRLKLDFVEVRGFRTWWIGELTEVDRADVSRALTRLVEWGYLLEHPKAHDQPRQFTLTWSVREDLRISRAA